MTSNIAMTPLSKGHIRIERISPLLNEADQIAFAGGGQHAGIIILKATEEDHNKYSESGVIRIPLEFNVYVTSALAAKPLKENRRLQFWVEHQPGADASSYHTVQKFSEELLSAESFPKSYADFIKRLLKLLQSSSFIDICKLECEMKTDEDPISGSQLKSSRSVSTKQTPKDEQMPDAESVQDILEHAYPSALTVESIALTLNCENHEILRLLELLEHMQIAVKHDDLHWVRASHHLEQRVSRDDKADDGPEIAIITSSYIEKLAVDAIIENSRTFVRYKTNGESNIYTLGDIGGRRVVATKLSAVGHTREAMTAAGSITTRLLENREGLLYPCFSIQCRPLFFDDKESRVIVLPLHIDSGFQAIQHVLIVGLGGAVPTYVNSQPVRLGDVVISIASPHAYVYCDRVEENVASGIVEGYAVKTWRQGDADQTTDLVRAVREVWEGSLEASDSSAWQIMSNDAADKLITSDYAFSRPAFETDKFCVSVGNQDLIEITPSEKREYSKLHIGAVGSGRNIMLNPAQRVQFANQFNIKAFDQEFDSVIESVQGNRICSWALIRGIADYTDGTTLRDWQPYAALQAAVVAACLIKKLKS